MIIASPIHRRGRARGNARFAVTTILVLGLVLAAIWYGFFRSDTDSSADVPLTAPLSRGPLRVTVSESGNLESLQSNNIVNTVEGRTTIDYIIPEGTILTPKDVLDGTVLVRLNGAALEEKRVRQEIEVSGARDSQANAQTGLEIQLQQNASDLRKADLDVRFAKLDLERYVGKPFARQLLTAYGPAATSTQPTSNEGGVPAAGHGGSLEATKLRRLISRLLDSEALEGEALQRIRGLKSDIQLADEEHRRSSEKVKHSVRLEAKGYVSREDLEADKLALERREIEKQRTRTARDQFVAYDFPKELEKLISGVVEAKDRRSRVAKKAKANEAQKRSAVRSREKQLELKKLRLDGLVEQERGLVITATVPGLVVYSSSGSGHRRRNDERIDEGSSVRQGQTLIKIPDPNSLGVITKVHESAIRNLKEGQEAHVEVDALPGSRLPARVDLVKRMPDAASWWDNPDLKVYHTELQLLGGHPTLKPGMSAQVEILVTTLEDVIAVPVQSVAGTADKPAVFVWSPDGVERREVVLGMASEHYIEIQSGVNVGERLLLDPPREERKASGEPENGRDAESETGSSAASKKKGRPSSTGTSDAKKRGGDASKRRSKGTSKKGSANGSYTGKRGAKGAPAGGTSKNGSRGNDQ